MSLSCPQCASNLKIQGVTIAYTRYLCSVCNRTFEVIHTNAPNLDAQESKPRVSYQDVIKGRMHR